MLSNPSGVDPTLRPAVVAISDDGDVIGSAWFPSGTPGSAKNRAAVWHDGTPTDIASEVKGGRVVGVNASGALAGNCLNDRCAFTVVNGKYQKLNGLSLAYGINNSGEVVGYKASTYTYAAVWANGVVTTMPHATASGWGEAINTWGDVAGTNPPPAVSNQPALWLNGKYRDLEPTGSCYGQTSGINDSSQTVGFISANDSCGGEEPQASTWTSSGKFTNLNPLTGQSFSFANAINNAGTIVGEAFGDSNVPSAWIYSHGTLTYLQSLIDPNTKWVLQDATAINNSGQIIGWGLYGNQTVGFLLTPNG